MKAQLKVGKGSGDLWAVPGVSTGFIQDTYLPEETWLYLMLISVAGFVITALLISIGGS
jgi:hypothetical protein